MSSLRSSLTTRQTFENVFLVTLRSPATHLGLTRDAANLRCISKPTKFRRKKLILVINFSQLGQLLRWQEQRDAMCVRGSCGMEWVREVIFTHSASWFVRKFRKRCCSLLRGVTHHVATGVAPRCVFVRCVFLRKFFEDEQRDAKFAIAENQVVAEASFFGLHHNATRGTDSHCFSQRFSMPLAGGFNSIWSDSFT